MIYSLVFVALFMVGLYSILAQYDLIKMVIGLNLVEGAVFFWTITMVREVGGIPIIDLAFPDLPMVDPIPQALTLTAIVISASTTALLLTLVVELNRLCRTIAIDSLRGLKE